MPEFLEHKNAFASKRRLVLVFVSDLLRMVPEFSEHGNAMQRICEQMTISFGFTSDWLREWCQSFQSMAMQCNAFASK